MNLENSDPGEKGPEIVTAWDVGRRPGGGGPEAKEEDKAERSWGFEEEGPRGFSKVRDQLEGAGALKGGVGGREKIASGIKERWASGVNGEATGR